MAISKGATVSNIFNVKVDLTSAVTMFITYEQLGRTVLEKSIEDITIETDKVTVDLTQQDTLRFRDDKPVSIQIRARLADGSAHVSNVVDTTASRVLKEGVI